MTEKDLRALLSQNIRRFRRYRKLSQADFAEKIDISIPFLSDVENGKKWVSPFTLVKMADALDIEAYELLKPDTVIPDNTVNMLEKYTADIYQIFGETLNNIQSNYIKQIKNKNSMK
ncbi:MAG: helix-turn-helix transcriptional regulator [Treponema sp.]|jgi:transcriptional regulator with XRE-family HTH domain|nr:helix-turn-helix transcriptional regulator [Treponema sp.]